MPGVVAALVLSLALAAGPGTPAPSPQQPQGWRAQNAARAKRGLLPRKPPARKPQAFDRRGRRILRVAAPPPTFLGEPVPLADADATAPLAQPAAFVDDVDAPGLRVAAGGVEADVEISPPRPLVAVAVAGVEARATLRPRSAGLSVEASGVETEVAFSLR